jgi:BirA family biotin operon repressor/biotin-[acetyl-CoA-carboxylase] ligase
MPFELPGRLVRWFSSIDSTMTVAAQLAREGCPSGTVVVADQQTAGMGRHGRSWHSEPGAGLYVSIVLRLELGSSAIPLIMLGLGIATQRAIAEVTGLAPDLRWPNDVLLDDKKCAGILANAEGEAIIAGIGVNVSHAGFPPELAPIATSLRLAGAPGASREELLPALVRSVEDCCRILANDGPAVICEMFRHASSYAQGRRVRIEQDSPWGANVGTDIVEGVTCGVNSSGFLIVTQDNGTETVILSGGVRPA